MNHCAVKYTRHGTELTFENQVMALSELGQRLINAGFRQSSYTIRHAITLEVESYQPYWYIGHNYSLDDIQWLVRPMRVSWQVE
jgi:hypothetical protein